MGGRLQVRQRSCQQYLAVEGQLVPPDPFRLRHRKVLSETIKAMVASRQPVNEEAVRAVLPKSVPKGESDHFVRLVLDELSLLYEGNAMRFGLRPLEFDAWRKDMGWDKDDE